MKKSSHIYSVTEISDYIRNMFDQDYFLGNISVCGEISGVSRPSSGHLYFDLKDQNNLIRVTFFGFSRRADLTALNLKNGDKVVVTGRVSVYTKNSVYQLNAKDISLDGEGEMYKKYLEIKAALEESGMFDPMYKKPLPRFVRKLGVVTSAKGRAIGDIQTAVSQRNPYVQIVLYPSLVQGEGAVETIVRGIETLDRYGVDVIIVGRGGGSMEDLFCFNAVEIAKAIFACNTPVVSAVGHEDDHLISDEVADHRSATPSLAVTDTVFDIYEYDDMLDDFLKDMKEGIGRRLNNASQSADYMEEKLKEKSPGKMLQRKRERVDDSMAVLTSRMKSIISSKHSRIARFSHLDERMRNVFESKKARAGVLAEKLDGVSPLRRMASGYAFVSDEKGRGIRTPESVKKGDKLRLALKGGFIHARVEKTEIINEDKK